MYTNEEWAILAKQGDKEAMRELWEQNQGLLFILMRRFFPLCSKYGLTPEDLMQDAYFALARAVDAYDPDKPLLLSSYLSYHVRNAAHDALGHRGRKDNTVPSMVSFDELLPGTDGITFADAIEDENAAAELELVQDDWLREQLRACLDDCMADMPPDQADTLRSRYFEGKTLQATADTMMTNRERVRQLESKGLRYLRKPRNSTQLRPFLYAEDCHGYGLMAFKNRGYVSRVEVLAGTY